MYVAAPDKNSFRPIAVLFALCLLLIGAIHPSYSVAATLNIPVTGSTDDAEERTNTSSPGTMVLTSVDLEMPWDGSKSQQMGMRFQNVGIPAGATIMSAYIQFTVDRADTGGLVSLAIKGQKATAPLAFSSTSFNISNRPRTTAVVNWSPPSWTLANVAGVDQRTPNLSAILQEVIAQPGWVSGNAVAILIQDNGSDSRKFRAAKTFNNSPANAPVLHVEYVTGSGNIPPTAVTDTLTVNADTQGSVDVLTNDSNGGDGGPLSVTAFDATSLNGGAVNCVSTGTCTFNPGSGFSGPDSFTYTVSDGLDTAVGLVSVNVTTVGGGGFQQDGSGLVSMEAENYLASVVSSDGHEWLPAGAGFAGYSGTDSLRALPDDNVSNGNNYTILSPRLDYQVNFTRTGTHYVWVRMQGPSLSSDAVHVGLDEQGMGSSKNIRGPVTGGYTWAGAKANGARATMDIVAGSHTVNVWMSETGTVIDKVVLTTDPAFDPSTINGGLGPNETLATPSTDADLSVAKTVDNSTLQEGDTVIYSVTVSNNGPIDATGVSLNDMLPSGLSYVSDDAEFSSTSYSSSTGAWVVGSLSNAASATLHITATVNQGTGGSSLTNTVSVSALDQTDSNATNDSAAVSVAVALPSSESPVLAAIDDQTVFTGSSLLLPLSATNPNTASVSGITIDSTYSTVDTTQLTVDSGVTTIGGTGLSFSATALPGFVTLSDNGDGTGSLQINPGNADAGSYTVTVRVTDTAVTGLTDEKTFTITVNPTVNSSASLSASMTAAPANVNLAFEGVSDWAAWGNPDVSAFNHKSGVTQQISNFTVVGTGALLRHKNTASSFSWSGGTPVASATNVTKGLRFGKQLDGGFELTVPAALTNRTLRLYVGARYAKGRFEATLMGSNLASYVGYVDQISGNATAVFTLNYRGSTAGQSLRIRYTLDAEYSGTNSHISLEGATLQGVAP